MSINLFIILGWGFLCSYILISICSTFWSWQWTSTTVGCFIDFDCSTPQITVSKSFAFLYNVIEGKAWSDRGIQWYGNKVKTMTDNHIVSSWQCPWPDTTDGTCSEQFSVIASVCDFSSGSSITYGAKCCAINCCHRLNHVRSRAIVIQN